MLLAPWQLIRFDSVKPWTSFHFSSSLVSRRVVGKHSNTSDWLTDHASLLSPGEPGELLYAAFSSKSPSRRAPCPCRGPTRSWPISDDYFGCSFFLPFDIPRAPSFLYFWGKKYVLFLPFDRAVWNTGFLFRLAVLFRIAIIVALCCFKIWLANIEKHVSHWKVC